MSEPSDNRAEPRWYTVKEVATRLRVSERTVYRWTDSGTLRHHRFGRAIRVSEEDLLTFERRCRR
jgi:excisionase family DNA binding protein